VAPVCILATWEAKIPSSSRTTQANSPQYPISKITRAKCTGGVAQAVEFLLGKRKAQSSNPSPTKKKKKTH
jgi:hypothetical protein